MALWWLPSALTGQVKGCVASDLSWPVLCSQKRFSLENHLYVKDQSVHLPNLPSGKVRAGQELCRRSFPGRQQN